MSVLPRLRNHRKWWIWQLSKPTLQPGTAQHRYMARKARRCSRLAVRESRPRYNETPSAPTMIGVISEMQAHRRNVSTGS